MEKIVNRFSRENLLVIDPSLLRAVLRERTHHTIEFKLYAYCKDISVDVPDTFGEAVRTILEVWDERGLDKNCPDVLWAKRMLELAEKIRNNESVSIDVQKPRKFQGKELDLVDELIFFRRSIRNWTKEPVPDEMMDDIIRAALWAPHACNLQTLRFAVLDNDDDPEIFKSLEFSGYQRKIIVMQDVRPYEFYKSSVPEHNRMLDCGAAVQTLLLYAHSKGLGAVWSTFNSKELELIKTRLALPEYIVPITYVALGWPESGAIPPARIRLEDAIFYRTSRA